MRRGLLALLVLLVSSSVAFAQGGQFFTQLGTTPTTKVSTDEVIARIMTFDQNNDGRVAIGELSERMRPMVDRGDKDGDRALDRAEVLALSRAPATKQFHAGFPTSGYGFGDDSGFSSRQHIEGSLEDLRLTSDKTDRALPVIRAYLEQLEAAARANLLGQLDPVLSPEQLWDLKQTLNTPPREVTLRTNVDGVHTDKVVRLKVNTDPVRRVASMGLTASIREQIRQVLDEYKLRTRLGREADRVELLAQLQDVLSAGELEDFGAALARRPVVANGGVFALNDALMRVRELNEVVRPATPGDRQFSPGVTLR
jgi:hypothetical protein